MNLRTLSFALTVAGCGAATYQPAPSVTLDLDPAAEINDEDVQKAWLARPQLGKPVRVAYFAFDAAKAAPIETALRARAGVAEVYRIPSLMMTGARRYDHENRWGPREAFSIKKARLLAARAKCDLLLVFDNGHKIEPTVNGWVVTGVLLLPLLFMPFLDAEVESYLEGYVIDTRNGYLYAHVTADQRGEVETLTIYSRAPERLVDSQWTTLLADTDAALGRVLEQAWARPPEVTVPVE